MIRILLHAYRRRRPPAPADSLVVLGTAQYDGTASRQFAARLDHALHLWETGVADHVYTLGGKLPGDRFTEAQVGRSYLVERGVPATDVTEVPVGNDTVGSYEGLVDKHEPGRVIVVTDPNHALRAEILARQAGLEAVSSPTRTSPTRFPAAAWWRTLAHEVGGMAVVDVSRVLGRRRAARVETLLRQVEAHVRPSRRARHDALGGK
ncbi:YdcF family protein [Corynebacterium sp.]|uniref:YdcF family protein n=1 Tax=Corynebacterium sp. TaxID=1720 RepID=UPI0026E067A0|nr:YdcF family protein [Corynebacterium sp.]MDO5513259.1 YdcF family protein [Corynebacterium sp.]